MRTIQVALDEDLLRAADEVARRTKLSRSALIREALRGHLKRLEARELERRDREGYERLPDSEGDFAAWEKIAVWPDD